MLPTIAVEKQFTEDPFENDDLSKVACTKKCITDWQKQVAELDVQRLPWEMDGLRRKNDPETSMAILLRWWMQEGNYATYRGKNNEGITKEKQTEAIAETMKGKVRIERNPKQARSKIEHMKERWRLAHNFATGETGAGVKEKYGVETFRSNTMDICWFYFDLFDIMADRASSKPTATSDNLDSSDSSDENLHGHDGDNLNDDDNDDNSNKSDDDGKNYGDVRSNDDDDSQSNVAVATVSGRRCNLGNACSHTEKRINKPVSVEQRCATSDFKKLSLSLVARTSALRSDKFQKNIN